MSLYEWNWIIFCFVFGSYLAVFKDYSCDSTQGIICSVGDQVGICSVQAKYISMCFVSDISGGG